MKFKRHLSWLFVSIIASIAILLLPSPMTPVVLAAAQPSGWIELIDERTPVGKKYLNLTDGRISLTTGLAQIHYESTPDSGIYDLEVDFTPRRINNAQLDGWTVTQSGWHYALGQPGDKSTDGWVGFGGRQGDHWVKFRLARVGYLHWPTRTWDDLGGPPTYDRANLASVTSSSEYGHGNLVNVQTTATWSNIWTTPDNGALNITWQASGDRLKEEIIINQAAREWLQTNRPPSTPASETWFGFVLQVDWRDIPKVIKDGSEQNINGDWNITNTPIELRDNLDRLLAFMPISEVIVRDGINETREPLTKRFWLDGDGNYYVLMGIRVPEFMDMPEGDLIFDPTVDERVGASLDDGWWNPSTFNSVGDSMFVGNSPTDTAQHIFARWIAVTIPQGATINVAYIDSYAVAYDGSDVLSNIYLNDIDTAVAPTTIAEADALALTTTFTAWDGQNFPSGRTQSPSIVDVVQEIVDRGGWSSGNAMMLVWRDDGTVVSDKRYDIRSYDFDTTLALDIHVEYTIGEWENTAPIIWQTYTERNGNVDLFYSEYFNATDPDNNQTLIWTLVTNASFLSIDNLNRTSYVNGTPTEVASYYVNVTVGDNATTGNLTDYLNYTLIIAPAWTNSAPTITNKINSDSGQPDIAYSRTFNATDTDSNQTLIWELNTTNAPFTITVSSQNRSALVSATPSQEGTFYVNVTVGDQASPNATDYVNYTLNVVATVEDFWGSTEGVIFIMGLIVLLIFIVLGIIIAPAIWVMGGIVSFLMGFVAYDATLSVWIVPMFAFLGIALILGGALKVKEGL